MNPITYTYTTTVSVTVDIHTGRVSKVTIDDENVEWTRVLEAFGVDEVGNITALDVEGPEVATALRCAERVTFPAWTFG